MTQVTNTPAQATATSFDRRGYIVLREKHGERTVIAGEANFSGMLLSDTYDQYGQKISAYDAGDSIEIKSQKAADFANDWILGEEFALSSDFGEGAKIEIGDIVSAYNDQQLFEALAENDDLKDEEDYKYDGASVTGYTYHDGSNWRTIITDHPIYDEEVNYERIDEEEEAKILAEWFDAEETAQGFGTKTEKSANYTFTERDFQGAWEAAVVEEEKHYDVSLAHEFEQAKNKAREARNLTSQEVEDFLNANEDEETAYIFYAGTDKVADRDEIF